MYRKSSKGNPYHDAKGRFTSAGAVGERETTMWSSFGEQHTKEDLEKQYKTKPKNDKETKALWEKADNDKTKVAVTDGRRHYHYQSEKREDVAKEIANYKIPKGTPRKEWGSCMSRATKRFRKENKVALANGGKVITLTKGTGMCYQVVESDRMAKAVTSALKSKKRESVTINTASHMKQFSGFTVEFTQGNDLVRSCKKGASPSEISTAISKYCNKHKKDLSDKNTCIKIWRNGDRVYFMPVYHFKTRKDAEAFALDKKRAKIIDNDDNSME